MAAGLTDFLRTSHYARFVRLPDRIGVPERDFWPVAGTTSATVWSLASLEHLFMRLRRAASRYESALVSVDILRMAS